MSVRRRFTSTGSQSGQFSEWVLSDTEDNQDILKVQEERQERTVTIQLEGSLRSDTLYLVRDELMALATVDADVFVNCENVVYLSNTCLKGLIQVQQFMDDIRRGTLTICALSTEIMEELKASGLTASLNIE